MSNLDALPDHKLSWHEMPDWGLTFHCESWPWLLRISPDFSVAQRRRPNWFRRAMHWVFFGWKWERA